MPNATFTATPPSFQDWLECHNLVVRWAWCYDSKRLPELYDVCLPVIDLDYSGLPQTAKMTNPEAPLSLLIDTLGRGLGRADVAAARQISNLLLEFEDGGLKAKGRAYIAGLHRIDGGKDGQIANAFGPVEWKFAKVDGRWWISGIKPNKPWWTDGRNLGEMFGRSVNPETGNYEYPENMPASVKVSS